MKSNQGVKTPFAFPSFLRNTTPCDYCAEDGAVLRCAQCLGSYYCTRECQKKDWKKHKEDCQQRHQNFQEHDEWERESANYEQKYNEFSDHACAICFEVIATPVQLPCHHIFCAACMSHYQETSHSVIKCPLCRTELSTSLFRFIYKHARDFIVQAHRYPVDSAPFRHKIRIARKEFDRLKDMLSRASTIPPDTSFEIDGTESELLVLEKRYKEAIALLRRAVSKYEHVLKHQKPTEAQWYRLFAEACEGMGEYQHAIDLLETYFFPPGKPPDETLGLEYVQVLKMIARCHYKLGNYEKAIIAGNGVITASRHFEGAHEYVAWSFKELGNWDEAIAVMRLAVRYVAPWSPTIRARYRQLLEDMLNEKDAVSLIAKALRERMIERGILPESTKQRDIAKQK